RVHRKHLSRRRTGRQRGQATGPGAFVFGTRGAGWPPPPFCIRLRQIENACRKLDDGPLRKRPKERMPWFPAMLWRHSPYESAAARCFASALTITCFGILSPHVFICCWAAIVASNCVG